MADTDVLANTLLPSLIAGVDFSHSPADLTGAQFVIPDATDNPLYAALPTLTEADLTERKVGGAGMFDALMQSIKEHLSEEYRANRMSGTEYREAYVALTQTAMGSAVQFLLTKDTAYWQAATAQQQARAAEAAVVRARVAIELDKMSLKALEVDKATKEVAYANAKQELATTEAQYDLLVLQGNQIGYQTDNLLPAQLASVTAETAGTTYTTANLLPAQLASVSADTAGKEYTNTNLLPQQLAKITADVNLVNAEELRVDAQTAQMGYETTNILPKQVDKLSADIAISSAEELRIDAQTAGLTYDTVTMKPAELAQLQSQTSISAYQLSDVLPKEVLRLQSQIDVSTAEISRVTAQKDQILYQTASVLPSQKNNVDADTDVKVYQLSSLYPSQVAKTSAETAGVEYTNSFILPAQKFNLDEQGEANRAKTLDTRSDASAVAGAIGKQKDLHSEQITSYKRDAEAKVAKLNLDLWMTQRSMDDATQPPVPMNTENFGTLFTNLKQNVGL